MDRWLFRGSLSDRPVESHGIRAGFSIAALLVGFLAGCAETPHDFIDPRQRAKLVIPEVAGQLDRPVGRVSPSRSTRAPGPALSAQTPGEQKPTEDSATASAAYSETFWAEVADLHLSELRYSAANDAQLRFAEGMTLLADGANEQAERAFAATSAQESDLNVAVASQMMLATTLIYEHKWEALRVLPSNPLLSIRDGETTASFERWGRAFASVTEPSTAFPQERVTLPLKFTAVGTPTVRVRINGKDYDFWLDTGSSITVLSSRVAADAKVSLVSEDTLSVQTFGGTGIVRAAAIERMEIGAITISNVPAGVMEASFMRAKPVPPGGPRSGCCGDGKTGVAQLD